jgi:uncharacterized membrane protein YedE/YeeE
MPVIFALASGLVFGIGLLVCGLANPAKVLAFLDLAGAWDPSLIVVMGVGVCVAAIAFAVAQRRNATLLGEALHLPTARDVDRRLVLGSLVFGVGWGLAGLCPGPALVMLGAGRAQGAVFVLAMLAGMAAFEIVERLRAQRAATA